MSAPIKCFLLEPTDLSQYSLRRYYCGRDDAADPRCATSGLNYHNAHFVLGNFTEADAPAKPDKTDNRWPVQCSCGYKFLDTDNWQLFDQSLYRRTDTGELTTIDDAPPGAMWRAYWYDLSDTEPLRYGFDWNNLFEAPLMVKTPGDHWNIDSRCSNCTRLEDKTHRCWCRHGVPPNITVDKNGDTCSAGAGSIIAGNWHGFLRNGFLTVC